MTADRPGTDPARDENAALEVDDIDPQYAVDAPHVAARAEPECNCGYGGFHEEGNALCERNRVAAQVAEKDAEIDRQRDLGWPDFHPETYCHRCGGRNVHSWHAPDDTWNTVVGDRWDGIVCPQCFTELARDAGISPSVWLLRDGDTALTKVDAARPSDEQVTTRQLLTNAILAHLDRATGGRDPSITGYVERLRPGHQAYLTPRGDYGGCTCGSPLCAVAVLIVHIDNLTAALAQSRQQFAAETLRVDAARRDALAPVLALHRDSDDEPDRCAGCSHAWPCLTVDVIKQAEEKP